MSLNFSPHLLDLKEPFAKILSTEDFGDTVNKIAELIHTGDLSKFKLETLLNEHGVKEIESIKPGILDMLLSYINLILDDNYITTKEAENVKVLKLFFKIKEGDFYHNKYYEIERILDRQFENIYRDDQVDNEEALQKVDLQELFNLSYDQFLELSNKAVRSAISRGANPLDLDTFIS